MQSLQKRNPTSSKQELYRNLELFEKCVFCLLALTLNVWHRPFLKNHWNKINYCFCHFLRHAPIEASFCQKIGISIKKKAKLKMGFWKSVFVTFFKRHLATFLKDLIFESWLLQIFWTEHKIIFLFLEQWLCRRKTDFLTFAIFWRCCFCGKQSAGVEKEDQESAGRNSENG